MVEEVRGERGEKGKSRKKNQESKCVFGDGDPRLAHRLGRTGGRLVELAV